MSTSGLKGEGVYSKIPELPNIEVIVVASVAKALGVDADVILGDRKTIQTLSSSSVYAGSSPPSPGILYAYVWASEIYRNGLNRLRDNMKVFTDLIQRKTGINYIKGFPVFLLKDQYAAEYLLKEGIIISSFPYPDPNSKYLNRIVLNSTHRRDELKVLTTAINQGLE